MRKKVRECVLKTLYSIEFTGGDPDERLSEVLGEENIPEEDGLFGRRLLHSTLKYKEDADKIIKKYLENWSFDRVAILEKNILRMAIAEMEFFPETPIQVIINEAVELAKKFVSSEAGKFVNGILDSIARERDLL